MRRSVDLELCLDGAGPPSESILNANGIDHGPLSVSKRNIHRGISNSPFFFKPTESLSSPLPLLNLTMGPSSLPIFLKHSRLQITYRWPSTLSPPFPSRHRPTP